MKKTVILIIINILFLAACTNSQDASIIDTIRIKSVESGWVYKESKFTVKNYNNQFYIKGKIASPEYSAQIMQLISTLEQPEINNIELENLGINQNWLNTNADIWTKEKTHWDNDQKSLFKKAFVDIDNITALIQEPYISDRGQWTDDYPDFEILIMYKNGSKVMIKSDSQLQFMLPWKIIKSMNVTNTYNAQISRAIADILPANFPNKNRIAGNDFLDFIAERIEWQIRDELSMIGTRNTIGAAMQDIEKDFIITESAFSHIGSINLNTESVWNATLISKAGPQNLIIGLDIPYDKQVLGSITPFLTQIPLLMNRVKSVDWLQEILENPRNEVEIRFVNNKSMSDYAQNEFINDMEKNGKKELIDEIKDQLDDACFLVISEPDHVYSRFILLPAGKTILWHFIGNTVLFWKENDFQIWDRYGQKSTGAIILQNGTLE